MTFRRHAGAGRGIDENTFFRVEGFEEEGVGNDTDIRTEAEEQDFIAVSHCLGERRRAESTFFYDDSFFGIRGECRADFPAFLRFNEQGLPRFIGVGRGAFSLRRWPGNRRCECPG